MCESGNGPIFRYRISWALTYLSLAGLLNRRTNKAEFFSDETGSVRWISFELDRKIDLTYSVNINIDLLWSLSYSIYKENFNYSLTSEEVAENEIANNYYRVVTLEQELIQMHYELADKENENAVFMTATQIKENLERLHPGVKTNNVSIGIAMRSLQFVSAQKYLHEFQVKGYYVLEKN